MAVKTKLTPDVEAAILSALRAGNYVNIAALHAGIDPDTCQTWIARGTEGTAHYETLGPYSQDQDKQAVPPEDGLFARFAREVARARADAEAHAVAVLRQAMTGNVQQGIPPDWRAAVEYLKRAHPSRWREEQRVEATVRGRIEHAHRVMRDDEALLSVLEALEEAGVEVVDGAVARELPPASNGSTGNGASG